jgi:hypothetical protein
MLQAQLSEGCVDLQSMVTNSSLVSHQVTRILMDLITVRHRRGQQYSLGFCVTVSKICVTVSKRGQKVTLQGIEPRSLLCLLCSWNLDRTSFATPAAALLNLFAVADQEWLLALPTRALKSHKNIKVLCVSHQMQKVQCHQIMQKVTPRPTL